MNQAPEIKEVGGTMLTGLVRQAMERPSAEILKWEHLPIRYINTEEAIFGVYRFAGMARDRGDVLPWSIILKAVRAPVDTVDTSSWNYHRREILAYQSGLLDSLPGGIKASRCLGLQEYADGICWLWLEDLGESPNHTWSLPEYSLAARHLGRFNGAYLCGHPFPVLPWLSRHWLRGWLAHYEQGCLETLAFVRNRHLWEHPLLAANFPRPIDEDILRLWDSYDLLLSVLERMPQTFCHMDAYRPNLFLQRDRLGMEHMLAIDWVFAGFGGLGEEIANLMAASLIWFEYNAAEAKELDQAVFAAYLNGLRDAGWQGDPRLVRLGYSSACALRWGVVGLWWLGALQDARQQSVFVKHWNHPMPELAAQWAKTTTFLLGLADEAYQLRKMFF